MRQPPGERNRGSSAGRKACARLGDTHERWRKQYRYHPDWRATRDAHKFDRLLAFGEALPAIRRRSERALKACINRVIGEVAAELRNTPAVCRKSYIDPLVLEGWCEGRLHRCFGSGAPMRSRALERRALSFLRAEARRS